MSTVDEFNNHDYPTEYQSFKIKTIIIAIIRTEQLSFYLIVLISGARNPRVSPPSNWRNVILEKSRLSWLKRFSNYFYETLRSWLTVF